jgi:hypothetical protein
MDQKILKTVTAQMIAWCRDHDESIDGSEQSLLFYQAGLLPTDAPPSLGEPGRRAYMAELAKLRKEVQRELGREGFLLEPDQTFTKNRATVHRLVDGIQGSLERVRNEPRFIMTRSKADRDRLKRFLVSRGGGHLDLSPEKLESLLKVLAADAAEAARGMERHYEWALEWSGLTSSALLPPPS